MPTQRHRLSGGNYGSVGGAMSGEIADILMEQEALKQQAFLNSLRTREATLGEERQRQSGEMQRAQLAALEDTRAAQAADRRSNIAGRLADTLSPGAELDESSTAALTDGGMGALIGKGTQTAAIDTTTGLGAPTTDNPLGLATGGGARMVEGRKRFTGTAKQNKDAQDRAARLAWVKAQPDSPAKRLLEAQLMTGDNSLSATMFEDPNQEVYVADAEDGTVTSAGTVPRGSRVVTKPRPFQERVPPKTLEQIEAEALARTAGAEAGRKPAKTPEQIFAEREAASAGTDAGKKRGGGGGLFSMIGGMLSPKSAGGSAAPKVGDTKKFPNGKTGVWDGTGWVAQ